MKADLLTYPLPVSNGKRIFGLTELLESVESSGMDLVCVTGFTDKDDHPDIRWKLFLGQHINLHGKYYVETHSWSRENNALTGLSVRNAMTDKRFILIYGQNGPANYWNNTIQVLRVGTSFHAPPNNPLDAALKQAFNFGSLVLLSPKSLSLVRDQTLLKYVHGVYWDAQESLPPTRKKHEQNIKLAKNHQMPIVPVSNAHMPYFGKPLEDRLTEIGRAHIKLDFDIHNTEWQYVSRLVEILRHRIKQNDYTPHFEYSPKRRVLKWKLAMAARKFAKRKLGMPKYDFTWPEDSLVTMREET